MNKIFETAVSIACAILLLLGLLMGGLFVVSHWPPWHKDAPAQQPEGHGAREQIPGTFYDND